METSTEPADSSSEEDYVYSVNKINSVSCPKELETSVTLNDSAEIKMMIDTGAFVNTLDEENFELARKRAKNLKLEKSKERIFAYGSKTPIPLLGKVTMHRDTNKHKNYCCDLLCSQRKTHLIDVISNCLRAGFGYNKHWQVSKYSLHQE